MFRSAPCLLVLALASLTFAQSPTPNSEVEKLKEQVKAKSQQIGNLVSSGKLPDSDQAQKLLEQLVLELRLIREQLTRLQGDGTAAQTPAAAAPGSLRVGGWAHFQYQDTDRKGSGFGSVPFDAFRFRRVRIILENTPTDRTQGRVSFDLATGTAETATQLRDVWMMFHFGPQKFKTRDSIIAGQQPLPLGYELERSSADREMPERSQFNQLLFRTERSRGVQVRHESGCWLVRGGVFNALTINDPEQANLSPGVGDKLVGVAAVRYKGHGFQAGLSALSGGRPAYTANNATSPEVGRRFAYADLVVPHAFGSRVTVMGELMKGHDRLPNATANPSLFATNMTAFSLVGITDVNAHDRVALRWEHFDPDTSSAGNALHGLGVAYLHEIDKNARLTLGHEIFVDQSRSSVGQTRYANTYFRLTFRF